MGVGTGTPYSQMLLEEYSPAGQEASLPLALTLVQDKDLVAVKGQSSE